MVSGLDSNICKCTSAVVGLNYTAVAVKNTRTMQNLVIFS